MATGFKHIMSLFGDPNFKTIAFEDPDDKNAKETTLTITDINNKDLKIHLKEADIINIKTMLDYYLHRSVI